MTDPNTPAPRPLLSLARTDRLVKLFAAPNDRYAVTITKLRMKPATYDNLSADDALAVLCFAMGDL